MKYIIKVSKVSFSLLYCYLIIILAAIPITSSAQDIIDTSSPQALVAAPTIVVTPSTIKPDCHTYTGCGVIIVKRYHTYHYYKPKRHCVYHRPCYAIGDC